MRLIGNVEKDAQVRAVASGALPSGDAVIVNADGTVSVVAGSPQEIGSEVVFETATANRTAITYDTANDKVVVVYRDDGNSNRGTAVVGTVSGTSITFGTPVVFGGGAQVTDFSCTYDTNAQKVVIAYGDEDNNYGYGTAVVGTVSGTSISFGTAVVFESAITTWTSCAYDANAQKVVIFYRDNGNSNYGTGIVGTVSGTSISFGSAAVFESATVEYITSTYDSTNQKVVVVYRDMGNSQYGTVVVSTVSGTSISFGTPVVYYSGGSSRYMTAAYDSDSQRVVIAYQDDGNDFRGDAIVGTVSGTSISFGTPVTFNDDGGTIWKSAVYDATAQKIVIAYPVGDLGNHGAFIVGTVSGTSISFEDRVIFNATTSNFMSSVYDPDAQKVVTSYADAGNSNYGTAVVFSTAFTNLTSENFLGFAAHTYADTQSALVNSTCTVDRNQTGLTAGQTYYVQSDGSLGTTAANPSVVAGTAISSTEIIVKG